MSASKRKAPAASTDLQDTFDAINDLVVKVKQKVGNLNAKNGASSSSSSLVDDLHKLAFLGERFTERRPKSNKRWMEYADALDREGVYLWNASGMIGQGAEQEDRNLHASLRLAGYRLVEAGLENKPRVESLIHMLQLASKTAANLSEAGYKAAAASVLTCAAKFEDQLQHADNAPLTTHAQARVRAVTLYYCSRMQVAWQDGNEPVALFMLEKMTEGENLSSQLPPHDREILASKVLDIAKSLMKAKPLSGTSTGATASIGKERAVDDGVVPTPDARKACNAVKWAQSAFTLVEKIQEDPESASASPGTAKLKQNILRTLARAYYLSSPVDPESLVRAETTLQELLSSTSDDSSDKTTPDKQQLRWMQLAVMKRRKAPDTAIFEAFAGLVDNMTFTESEIRDVLQELRTLTQQHSLVTSIVLRCLQRTLEMADDGDKVATIIDRLLVFTIFHASRSSDHATAMKDVENACTRVAEAGYELKKVPATACISILWQFGDKYYQAKDWSRAADWFLAGAHSVFSGVVESSNAKCCKKAALCYIEQRDFARASAVIRRCPSDQASTCYIAFLIATRQGLEDEAVSAVKNMVKAVDFDKKMLLLATQLAHELDLKILLLNVLEALLDAVKVQRFAETYTESIVLVRCIVRLLLRLMKQPGTNQRPLIESLIRHFRFAVTCVSTAQQASSLAMISKDISWLWRTAYNTAVQGCAEWEHAEGQVADVFEAAYELLQASCQTSVISADSELYAHKVYALFGAISGRAFDLRSLDPGQKRDELQTKLLDRIQQYYKLAIATCENQAVDQDQLTNQETLDSSLHVIRVFEVEVRSQRKEWEHILECIKRVGPGISVVKTYEAIADILWTDADCPVTVLYAALEAILHAFLDRSALSLEKFSRWLRAICTILLSRNSPADRSNAISYVEQALSVLEEYGKDDQNEDNYPPDERLWLLSTAYNTGVECLAALYHDEAKRWFECSTVLCRFVPDGALRSEKISTSYQKLLEQYPHRRSP